MYCTRISHSSSLACNKALPVLHTDIITFPYMRKCHKAKLLKKLTIFVQSLLTKFQETIMAEEKQPVINVWKGVSVSSLASQTRMRLGLNSGVTKIGYAANINKADFNRDVHVDIHCISGESEQARHYEVPEAIAINGDENQEHPNDQIIVDGRPLPWYIRIDFWKLCVLDILIVSAVAAVIVVLTITHIHANSFNKSMQSTQT